MLTGQFGDSKINKNILVTGASGFVGSALYRRLLRDGRNVFGLVRSLNEEDEKFIKGDILSVRETDFSLCKPDVVIHCAGLTKSSAKAAYDKNSQLHAVNVEGALNVARQASLLKCRRFIFMSSVKVNGEATPIGQPFTLYDSPAPLDAYGKSKWEAEKRLIDFTRQKGMELVIIRSPLIYGPQVKGNFAALTKLLELGIPLPLAKIKNKRSLIGIDNLVDLIATCIDHPNAANQVFFASDEQDLSTPELLRGMANAMEISLMLFLCPPKVLYVAALTIGKAGLAEKLLGSLQVDISNTKHLLGWLPPVSVQDGLNRYFRKYDSFCGVKRINTMTLAVLRIFDIAFAILGLISASPVMLLIFLLGCLDTGQPIFRQERLGRNQIPFILLKFRTMAPNTPSVATHLASPNAVTSLGSFLRRTKFDELPQLWNVLRGDMSLIGPRPGLPSQPELTVAREKRGVFAFRPGITGLAQINGIDMSTPELLSKVDAQMIAEMSVRSYFWYLFSTLVGQGRGDRLNTRKK